MASLVEKFGWREWLCHSNFSFKIGASFPDELVETAEAFGYHGIGVSDFDGVYGLSRAYQALKNLQRHGRGQKFKLFFGAEVHLEKDHAAPLLLQNTLVLMAKTHRGYFNLCQLLTYAHRAGKLLADIPLKDLTQADVKDLIAIQPMRGLVYQDDKLKIWQNQCQSLFEHFGKDNFYFAFSRHLNAWEDCALPLTSALAKRLQAPCLLSQDVFFHKPQQKDVSDLLNAIRNNKTLNETVEHNFMNAEHCLHSLRNIEQRFKHLPIYASALQASENLAQSCVFNLNELRYHYPKEMLPENYTAQEFLTKLTWESAHACYGENLPEKIRSLLQRELALIQHLDFADYFLTVWDIVRFARSKAILCQGRGSAANSGVCFVLGITAVDPALFDVLFERFISVERGDPPDIDVDFEHERREEVIAYIYERYGRDRAAMVANVVTFQSRGALRAAGKALGFSEEILGKASKVLLAREFRRGGGDAVMHELKQVLTQAELTHHDTSTWQLWAAMADRLRGFPSHLGIHSGGFILSDCSLNWLCPQEPATMEGRSVVQWSKTDVEALGFFKIDVLALGILTAIRKCFADVKDHYGKELTLANIPPNDKQTYDMICRSDTVGTFQIESRAQMSMLPRLKPRCFYDLVIEVAIIRPGPIQGGMIHPFLKRREGLEPIHFPDPRLEPILKRTLGVPIFQEQVMRIAMAVGGFTPGEANELRAHLGSFSMKGDTNQWIGRLAEGMQKNGIAKSFIETILQQLKGFASYGFPESHAASFALLAYASSYLKCHFPEAYFAAILNSQPMGFYSPHVLLQTAKHLGMEILPICVRQSHWDFTLEPLAIGKGYGIRMGLRLVNCLSTQTGKNLVEKRQRVGGYATLAEFLRHGQLSRVDFTALAAAGALHSYGVPRRAAIWLALAAPFSSWLEDVEEALPLAEETPRERLQADFAAFSTSLGPHPVKILKDEWCYPVPLKNLTLAAAIVQARVKAVLNVFGMVIVRQAPPAAKGMVFATIEDESGLINLVITPQVYEQFKRLFNAHAFVCVQGVLQKQGEAFSLKVGKFFAPQVKEAEVFVFPEPEKVEEELVSSRNYC